MRQAKVRLPSKTLYTKFTNHDGITLFPIMESDNLPYQMGAYCANDATWNCKDNQKRT